ncbi:hypothetical protein WN51_10774 [Melipona quadrifasciata]|uniref:Uncharacterized protein n=1 Tax=Melipona quadrifasciata TaxID=166423 RepID=A0A0N0BHY6_9HYME|nr:hypothetical protein WN51_10774 [Melipona quadrifasciata]
MVMKIILHFWLAHKDGLSTLSFVCYRVLDVRESAELPGPVPRGRFHSDRNQILVSRSTPVTSNLNIESTSKILLRTQMIACPIPSTGDCCLDVTKRALHQLFSIRDSYNINVSLNDQMIKLTVNIIRNTDIHESRSIKSLLARSVKRLRNFFAIKRIVSYILTIKELCGVKRGRGRMVLRSTRFNRPFITSVSDITNQYYLQYKLHSIKI